MVRRSSARGSFDQFKHFCHIRAGLGFFLVRMLQQDRHNYHGVYDSC
jgi:hypothetical protein